MLTLGIHTAFRDCAACILRGGIVRNAAEEERDNRLRHDERPVRFTAWELLFHTIDDGLRGAGVPLAIASCIVDQAAWGPSAAGQSRSISSTSNTSASTPPASERAP